MKSGLSQKKGTSSVASSSWTKVCSLSSIIFTLFVLTFIVTAAMSSFVITMYASNPQEEQAAHSMDERELLSSISESYLLGEDKFLNTIKSCIPTGVASANIRQKIESKCAERKKSNGDNKLRTTMNRVGILAPPGKIGDAFFELIKEVVERTNAEFSSSTNEVIIIERESHVPPYGYGGNHGWTKVVRLILPLKMSLEEVYAEFFTTATTISSPNADDVGNNKQHDTILSIFRQVIRWHCRLSHFAAHTALITVNASDFVGSTSSSDIVLNSIYSFITGPYNSIQEDDATQSSKKKVLVDSKTFYNALSNLNTNIATTLKRVHEREELESSLKADLENVLVEELDATNQLSDWPCKSFLSSLGDRNKQLQNDPILQKISRSLSPNCQSNFVKCTIDIDKCEFKAESACS